MTIEDELRHRPQEFRDYLASRGLAYDPTTQVDMLACTLGSQFLLFAGPSGTGKSTAAKALAEFFSPPSRRATIDARPAWTSSEDLAGQYSVFAGEFVLGPATEDLVRLGSTSEDGPPILIVEEANLSPMEAYIGPVITAASPIVFKELKWPLHRHSKHVSGPSSEESAQVPGEVVLSPFPRIFATVNVDSTAEAPAPKVSGRACVVLLEPPDIETAVISVDALSNEAIPPPTPPGAPLLRDPRSAWASHLHTGPEGRYTNALRGLLDIIANSAGRTQNIVSPRDVQRCVTYMSWHVPLAEAAQEGGLLPQTTDVQSAENSILHFVLPGLSSQQFGQALEPLTDVATEDGLLKRRLTRLLAGGESLFGVAPDFWASLS